MTDHDPHDADITKMIAEMTQYAFEAGRELGRHEARLEWHMRIRRVANAHEATAKTNPPSEPRKRGQLRADVLAALTSRPHTRAELEKKYGASVGAVLRTLQTGGEAHKEGRIWHLNDKPINDKPQEPPWQKGDPQ